MERPTRFHCLLLFLRFTASFNSHFSETGLDLLHREAGPFFIVEWPYIVFSVVLSRRRWSIFISCILSGDWWYFSWSRLCMYFLLYFELTGSLLNLWDNQCLNPQLDSFWSDEMPVLETHIVDCILSWQQIQASASICFGVMQTIILSSHILKMSPDYFMSWQMYWKNIQQLLQNLIRKLATVSQYEEVLAKINATSTDCPTVLKTKPQSIQRDIITVCNDPYVLAQQLTHIELVSCYTLSMISSFPSFWNAG